MSKYLEYYPKRQDIFNSNGETVYNKLKFFPKN